MKQTVPHFKGHMIRVGEMAYNRLHVLRLRVLNHMIEKPHLYPDRSVTHLSMADLIDMLLAMVPVECFND